MSLRSRSAIAVAVGTLLTATLTAAPAFANDDWGQTPGNDGWEQGQNANGQQNQGNNQTQGQNSNAQQNQGNNQTQDQNSNAQQNQGKDWGQGQNGNGQQDQGNDRGEGQSGNQRFYRGVVTADSLALRSAPTRGAQVIRYADRGEILNIFCKVGGPSVQGNPLWYQIADGTWAWGAARHIDNIGAAPRWC